MKLAKLNPFWVRNNIALILLFFLQMGTSTAQSRLPLIRAISKNVIIKDGYIIREGIWNLSPEEKPDIYTSLEPNMPKKIAFYTDVDSIVFHVKPGNNYDFNVLLNGKDTCLTRISVGVAPLDLEATTNSEIPLNTEQMAMDFVVFREYLKTNHPGLYRYQAKEKIDNLLDSCLLSIDRPLTNFEFAKKILFAISEIQDGHTGTNFSSILVKSYEERIKLFPIYLYFNDNKALISCYKSNQSLVGSEIVSINSRAISEVRKELLRYLPSDGSIETKKIQTLNNGAFSFLYKWIFGHGDSLNIKYKTTDGVIKSTTVAAEYVKDFECEFNVKQLNTKALSLTYPQSNVALLTIKTFDDNRLRSANLDFKAFLRQSFSEINKKNTKDLIIDLRGNAGGLDAYGSLLYSYLAKKPFKYFASIESTRKKYTVSENHLLDMQSIQDNSFKGNVLFLINGLSFSTTAEVCAIAKSNERGTFIGEETGGGYYGNTSGQTIKIELPHSKINVIIPKFRYVNDVKENTYPDRGVLPDYVVTPSIKDLINKHDVQLQYALDLIQKK